MFTKKTVLISILIILLLASIVVFLFSQKNTKKPAPSTNTDNKTQTEKPKGPYILTGYVGSVDLKNNTLDLVAFSTPKKIHKVKITDQTLIYQFRSVPDSKASLGPLTLKIIDLKKDTPLQITSSQDPNQSTSLTALAVRKLLSP